MLSAYLNRVFSIDSRALAAFRMAMGTLIVIDIALRSADLVFHYTDLGVLPRADFYAGHAHRSFWTILALNGSATFAAIIFAVTALCATALAFGYRTRWATVLTWFLFASVQNRNPYILNSGDVLLLALLFWSMFLPLGDRWSLDRVLRKDTPCDSRRTQCHISTATAAILIQVALMYFFAGLYKCNRQWFGGTALSALLSNDILAHPLAVHVLNHPLPLKLGSYLTPLLEISLPLLCFSPWFTGRLRCAVFIFAAVFHLSVEMLLTTGLFAYVSLSGWLLYLPPTFWGRVEALTRTGRAAPLISQRADGTAAESQRPTFLRRPDAMELIPLVLIIYVGLYNVHIWLQKNDRFPIMPKIATSFAGVMRLAQTWEMFSLPESVRGWFVITGVAADGRSIDLMRNQFDPGGMRKVKPEQFGAQFPNHRWAKYYERLLQPFRDEHNPELLSRALAKEWNRGHPPSESIKKVEIEFLTELPVSATGKKQLGRSLHHIEVLPEAP